MHIELLFALIKGFLLGCLFGLNKTHIFPYKRSVGVYERPPQLKKSF